jgi:hypothetical protein
VAYANTDDVLLRAGRVAGMFTVAGRRPNLADVEKLIDDVSSEIDVEIRTRGYDRGVVPDTATKSPSEMTVAELDQAYRSLDGYPAAGTKADKVSFADTYEASQPQRETAFVLTDDAVASDAPYHFANFPGVWTPGEAIAARELLAQRDDVETIEELKQLVADENLPLRATMVDTGTAEMPRAATQIPSEEEVRLGEVDAPVVATSPELIPTGSTTAATVTTESAGDGEQPQTREEQLGEVAP